MRKQKLPSVKSGKIDSNWTIAKVRDTYPMGRKKHLVLDVNYKNSTEDEEHLFTNRHIVQSNGGVRIILIDQSDNSLVMIKQARLALALSSPEYRATLCRSKDSFTLELPGGGIDPGEMPQQAALKELLEEVFCLASKEIHPSMADLKFLKSFLPFPWLTEITHIFVAEIKRFDAKQEFMKVGEAEIVCPVKVPEEEVRAMLAQQKSNLVSPIDYAALSYWFLTR